MHLPEQVQTTDIRATDGLYTVLVNDTPLFTPKGRAVQFTSWDLANALADDLIADGSVDLQRLTFYTLYATQYDFVMNRLDATIGAILQHLPGDFALHPDADPSLAARQLDAWAPLLTYLRDLGPELPLSRPLQDVQIPWELTESLRAQLTAMSSAQLTVVLYAVTNFGSVVLGILLAKQGIEADQATSALTVTARHQAGSTPEAIQHTAMFSAEMRQSVRRLLQYVRLSD